MVLYTINHSFFVLNLPSTTYGCDPVWACTPLQWEVIFQVCACMHTSCNCSLCIEPQYMSSRYPEVGRMNELSEERYKLTSAIRRVVRDVLKTI